MVHPQMFDDDDPLLAQVRAIALALPGAQEKISHGGPAFFTTEVHCCYGGSVTADGTWHAQDQAVVLIEESSRTAAPKRLVTALDGAAR